MRKPKPCIWYFYGSEHCGRWRRADHSAASALQAMGHVVVEGVSTVEPLGCPNRERLIEALNRIVHA